MLSLFGSLPFIFSSGLDPVSAYFESMSGFTTTGLTMFKMEGPGLIDASWTILFWRSLSQWVGGIGIMVLFISSIVGAGGIAKKIFSAEGGGGRYISTDEGPEISLISTTRSVWKIYLLFTVLAVLVLYAVGMPMFESINHAMTSLGTGGFSVTSDSFASYSHSILIVALFPMIVGAINFVTHVRVFMGDWKALFRSLEFRLMILLLMISTFILAWDIGIVDGLFSGASALTTVGFSSVNVISGPAWGALEKSVLVVLMVLGGGFGSTAGAIKLIRTVLMIMALYWLVKKAILPDRAVVPFKIGGRVFKDEEILQTSVFVFAYIIILVFGSLITMAVLPGESAINCIFDSASAQGTVGLSAGITGPNMPVILKITYTIQMWIGRLEVIPVITFISYVFVRTSRHRAIF